MLVIDDPLFVVMQGIWLLAAGMYPLGFLFGACSACCSCQPCKCSHHAIADYEFGFGSANRFSLSNPVLTINGSAAFPADDTLYDSGDGLSIVSGMTTYTNWQLRLIETEIFAVVDDCACWISASEVFLFRVRFFDEFGQGDAEAIISARYDYGLDCDDSGGNLVFDEEATSTSGQDFADFVTDLAISGDYSFDACECGACCDDGCEDNVAEQICGNWAGVGTACDDDPPPCPEPE